MERSDWPTEGSHEVGPSVLGRVAHAPLADGFMVGVRYSHMERRIHD